MVWAIFGGFFNALYAVMCLRELGLPESTFGIIIAMGGIGSLVGATIARPLARAIGVGRTMILAAAASTLGAVFMPLAAEVGSHTLELIFLAAHQLISDGFAVVFLIQAVTLRQTVLPKHMLGRANAAVLVFTTGALLVSTLLAGAIAQLTTVRLAVWIGVLIGLFVPAFVWPLRRLREMPAPDASSPGFPIAGNERGHA
jgi:MFS family permease